MFLGCLRAAVVAFVTLLAAGAALEAQEVPPPYEAPDLAGPAATSSPLSAPTPPAARDPAPVAAPAAEAVTPSEAPRPAVASALVAPDATVAAHYNAGRAALDLGQLAKAIEHFTAAIAAAPGYEPPYADRAVAYIRQKNYDKAVVDLTKALDLTANVASAAVRAPLFANRGTTYGTLKQLDRSIADFDQALALDPTMAFAWANRAYSHYQHKNYDATIADATRAVALKPSYEFAYSVRGYAYNNKKQFDLAIADFNKILALSAGNQMAIFGLRTAYLLGKPEERAKIKVVRLADAACEPACAEWITIDGKIEHGAADQLRAVLRQVGKRKLPVFVNSGGGLVDDSLEMGRMIRAAGLDVMVTRTEFVACGKDDQACRKRVTDDRGLGRPYGAGAMCASACGFLIAAGIKRYVGPGGVVGVHQIVTTARMYQPTLVGGRIVNQPVGEKRTVRTGVEKYVAVRKFFEQMGIGEDIMTYMISEPNTSMHWLTLPELRATRIMTDAGDGAQLIARGALQPAGLNGVAAPIAPLPGGTVSLQATPPVGAILSVDADAKRLAQAIQKELTRLGCGPVAEDGKWNQAVRRALDRYNRLTGRPLKTASPLTETLEALTARQGPVCPLACPPEMTENDDGQCIANKPGSMAKPDDGTGSDEKTAGIPGKEPKTKLVSLPGPEPEDGQKRRREREGERGVPSVAPNIGGANCHNTATSCSGALSSCLSNCNSRHADSRCFNDCNSAVIYCRSSGVWRTSNCLKTGMAH